MSSSLNSSSSIKSFFYYGDWVEERYCDCGINFELKTHWRDDDVGRRYYICKKYGVGGCGMRIWYDPPMCARAIKLIPRLLRKLDKWDSDKVQSAIPEPLLGCIDDNCIRKVERLKLRNKELRQRVHNQQNKLSMFVCLTACLLFVCIVLWLTNVGNKGTVKGRLSIQN